MTPPVCATIKVKELWCYSFKKQVFDWFECYLTDRQQLTLVNNIMLDPLHEDIYGVCIMMATRTATKISL